jgi:hypothetical protein
MTMHLEISMPMLEHQLAPPELGPVACGGTIPPQGGESIPLQGGKSIPSGWFFEECADYKSGGAGVWTLDEAFHQLQMQV